MTGGPTPDPTQRATERLSQVAGTTPIVDTVEPSGKEVCELHEVGARGEQIAAYFVRGNHTPGFMLDHGLIVRAGSPIVAVLTDGITGRDGKALHTPGVPIPTHRRTLGGGFVAERLPKAMVDLWSSIASGSFTAIDECELGADLNPQTLLNDRFRSALRDSGVKYVCFESVGAPAPEDLAKLSVEAALTQSGARAAAEVALKVRDVVQAALGGMLEDFRTTVTYRPDPAKGGSSGGRFHGGSTVACVVSLGEGQGYVGVVLGDAEIAVYIGEQRVARVGGATPRSTFSGGAVTLVSSALIELSGASGTTPAQALVLSSNVLQAVYIPPGLSDLTICLASDGVSRLETVEGPVFEAFKAEIDRTQNRLRSDADDAGVITIKIP